MRRRKEEREEETKKKGGEGWNKSFCFWILGEYINNDIVLGLHGSNCSYVVQVILSFVDNDLKFCSCFLREERGEGGKGGSGDEFFSSQLHNYMHTFQFGLLCLALLCFYIFS